ncbi:MAG TPA: MFS transporter, partial [Syntrophorhabdales bacterium]|nr:MFS transporter [Syntrophorhabdales bacterium]
MMRPVRAAPGTPLRWRVLWAAFFSYLVDSYDLIVLAIAMPVLLKVLNVPLGTGGLLFSGTMVGAIFGSILFGLLAENYGRRFALILSLLWLGVAMGLILFIATWWQLLLLRLFAGLAIGGLWGPCSALIAEHWSPESRGRASSFVYSSFAVGAMLASLAGRLVLNVDWRTLFLFGSASIILALVVALLIPAAGDRQADPRQKAGRKVGIGAIFAPSLLRTTILATLVSLFNLAGYWGAASWLPTFLVKERGLSLGTMANFSLFMYVGMFAGFQIFGMLTDAIGRRRSMMAAFFLVSFSLAVYILSRSPLFLFWWGTIVGIGVSG